METEEEKSELKKRKRDENEKAPFYSILSIKRDRAQKAQLTTLPSTSFLGVGVMFKGRKYCDVSKKLTSSLRERRGLKHAVVLLSET